MPDQKVSMVTLVHRFLSIKNNYLTAPCREKIYFIASPELGSDQGKIMIIRRALYGLKSSGAAFRSFLQKFYMIWDTNPVELIKMYGYNLPQLKMVLITMNIFSIC